MEIFSQAELCILRKLNSPKKIQDFLETIPINFDYRKDTCLSPRMVLRKNKAHCIEGAVLAAACLELHGQKPLIMDLSTTKNDFDHVLALFRQHSCWGAITKTNHAVLRYREPIYKTVRELAMSYFHEYFLDNGQKTMRSYSVPVDLSKIKTDWRTAEGRDVWEIAEALVKAKHIPVLNRKQVAGLRKADPIERKAGKLVNWKYRK